VLAKFGKFLFEHFAWGQVMLYYNCVSTVTKDRILGKAWEAQLAMLAARKKCWAGFVKKMDTQELAPGGGKFFAPGSTTTRHGASAYSDPCTTC
jgi:hypothetical protein